jgi:tryptophanyl-tRNA synthetase
MSKSASVDKGVIWLLDEPTASAKKIMSATTDSDGVVRFDAAAKPGISNLLTIYSVLSGVTVVALEEQYAGSGYGDFKKDLAAVVVDTFGPIRTRALELLDDPAELDRILARNADRAAEIANVTLATAYERVGFLPRA